MWPWASCLRSLSPSPHICKMEIKMSNSQGCCEKWNNGCKTAGKMLSTECSAARSCSTLYNQAPLSMRFSRQRYWRGLPSSRGSPWPRHWTCLSCVSRIGGFFTAKSPRWLYRPHSRYLINFNVSHTWTEMSCERWTICAWPPNLEKIKSNKVEAVERGLKRENQHTKGWQWQNT